MASRFDFTFKVSGIDRDGRWFVTTAKAASTSWEDAERRVRRVSQRLFGDVWCVVLTDRKELAR